MTVENAIYLKQLNPSYPQDGDLIKEGDDHIRLIKSTLRNTFKNIDRQVLISTEQLNDLISYKDYVSKQIERAYPVGSIYMSVNSTDPNSALGFGTWEAISQGRVLIGAGTGTDVNTDQVAFLEGGTGGVYSTKILSANIPQKGHTHTSKVVSVNKQSQEDNLATVPVYKLGDAPEDVPLKRAVLARAEYYKKYGNPFVRPQNRDPLGKVIPNPLLGYDFVKDGLAEYTPVLKSTVDPIEDDDSGVTPIANIQPYLVTYMWKRTS